MLKFCIFDNDNSSMKQLNEKLEITLNKLHIVSTFLCCNYENHLPDKINFHTAFIKINSDEKGIKIAEHIHKVNPAIQIVFISEYENLVFKSLRFRPTAFIKPENLDSEIENVLKIVIREINIRKNTCIFTYSTNIIGIKIDDITYIERINHDVFVHKSDGSKEKITATLEKLETKMSNIGFIRIHSGYIVNYRAISKITKNTVIISDKDKTVLPLSRRRHCSAKKAFRIFSDNEEFKICKF